MPNVVGRVTTRQRALYGEPHSTLYHPNSTCRGRLQAAPTEDRAISSPKGRDLSCPLGFDPNQARERGRLQAAPTEHRPARERGRPAGTNGSMGDLHRNDVSL
jgi:hypothetical protein